MIPFVILSDKKKRSDSSWLGKPCPPADEQDFRSRRDQQKHEGDGGYQGQRWPKQTRGSERRGSREVNEYAEVCIVLTSSLKVPFPPLNFIPLHACA